MAGTNKNVSEINATIFNDINTQLFCQQIGWPYHKWKHCIKLPNEVFEFIGYTGTAATSFSAESSSAHYNASEQTAT